MPGPGPEPDAAYPRLSMPTAHCVPIPLQGRHGHRTAGRLSLSLSLSLTLTLTLSPTLSLTLTPILTLTQAVTVTALLGAGIAFQFFVLANL